MVYLLVPVDDGLFCREIYAHMLPMAVESVLEGAVSVQQRCPFFPRAKIPICYSRRFQLPSAYH